MGADHHVDCNRPRAAGKNSGHPPPHHASTSSPRRRVCWEGGVARVIIAKMVSTRTKVPTRKSPSMLPPPTSTVVRTPAPLAHHSLRTSNTTYKHGHTVHSAGRSLRSSHTSLPPSSRGGRPLSPPRPPPPRSPLSLPRRRIPKQLCACRWGTGCRRQFSAAKCRATARADLSVRCCLSRCGFAPLSLTLPEPPPSPALPVPAAVSSSCGCGRRRCSRISGKECRASAPLRPTPPHGLG